MTFTDVNVATLVAWFITGVVMMFSGSYFMSKWKFRKYYHYLQMQAGGEPRKKISVCSHGAPRARRVKRCIFFWFLVLKKTKVSLCSLEMALGSCGF